jgi:hypothetical protein
LQLVILQLIRDIAKDKDEDKAKDEDIAAYHLAA